ncbi:MULTISPECIES: glycine cleavage system aminomethyltransferase GcvT [unclassified Nocardioides]|uniref:glycine cleavage system aminomethyltransferase GcvT n=1 Tax=unclassified Nocardioides TaxID=2615069 RepID=UPI0009F0EA20|nr:MULTISPECIES: glycine cleavage system aminomethyltransferase GcvT [unclassified Nocardioides]GAW49334.1 glycine cleavage system aminomethyltransferase T [Nocardioides sp. PD653-B2]GAW55152.1 glycine cleavage system aminomethyltransferase T [Nocardioides sp. PD653]
MSDLLRSPLHDRHEALGAKFAAFGGWSMPLEYPSGVVKEHTAVRESVGIFDVSHLGKAEVTGPGAAGFVNRTLTNDLGRIGPGQAQYTLCCDDASGGVVDDLIAYLHDEERVLLVPNAANTAEVVRRLDAEAPEGITVANRHRDLAVLAVQGTKSDEVLATVGLPAGHDYMSFVEAPFEGETVVVCRTGYTGERGYELVAPNAVAVPLWDALMAAGEEFGMLACGLGARDTLRTEMGYPLHGQDISPDVTPNEARLGWAVGWTKDAFWGRDVLTAERAEGPKRILRGLVATGRGIPRPHMSVSLTADVLLGEITSGTFSPTLRKGIGLALLPSFVDPDAEVGVDIRGRREIFQLVKPPFVDPSVRES